MFEKFLGRKENAIDTAENENKAKSIADRIGEKLKDLPANMRKKATIVASGLLMLGASSCSTWEIPEDVQVQGGVGMENSEVYGWVQVSVGGFTFSVYQGGPEYPNYGDQNFPGYNPGDMSTWPEYAIGYLTHSPTPGDLVYIPGAGYAPVANFPNLDHIDEFYNNIESYYQYSGATYYQDLNQYMPIKLKLNTSGPLAGQYSEAGLGY